MTRVPVTLIYSSPGRPLCQLIRPCVTHTYTSNLGRIFDLGYMNSGNMMTKEINNKACQLQNSYRVDAETNFGQYY